MNMTIVFRLEPKPCALCPRKCVRPECKYCIIHREMKYKCNICLAPHKTKNHAFKRIEYQCERSYCRRIPVVPIEKPTMCLRCFGSSLHEDIKKKYMDRCCFCMKIGVQSVFAYSPNLNTCLSCTQKLWLDAIGEHLPLVMFQFVSEYLFSPMHLPNTIIDLKYGLIMRNKKILCEMTHFMRMK